MQQKNYPVIKNHKKSFEFQGDTTIFNLSERKQCQRIISAENYFCMSSLYRNSWEEPVYAYSVVTRTSNSQGSSSPKTLTGTVKFDARVGQDCQSIGKKHLLITSQFS